MANRPSSEPTEEETRDFTDQVMMLVLSQAEGDMENAKRALERLAEGGNRNLYALASGLCAIITQAIAPEAASRDPKKGFYSFDLVGPDGKVYTADDIADDGSSALHIARILIAYANQDMGTLFDLFTAAWNAGQYTWLYDLIDAAGDVAVMLIREPVEGRTYQQCGVCEETEDKRIPHGGFTTVDGGPLGAGQLFFTPHHGWCPLKKPEDTAGA